MAPENQWLEDDSCPFEMVPFFGGGTFVILFFRGCI